MANPGNPVRTDPDVMKLERAMRDAVNLVRSLQGRVDEEHYIHLRASALGLMMVYSEITGLPSPLDYVDS